MNIFLSYAFTGESQTDVRRRMNSLCSTLSRGGNSVYCNMFDEETSSFSTPREFIDDALIKLRNYETVLVINTSERRSEGMLIEVGAALALGKRVVVAQHTSSVGTMYLPELAAQSFVWHDDTELLELVTDFVHEPTRVVSGGRDQ